MVNWPFDDSCAVTSISPPYISTQVRIAHAAAFGLSSPSGRGVGSRLVKVGRNDHCPCGSGAEVKRCFGVHRVRRARARLEVLLPPAFLFPPPRPASRPLAA